MDTGPWDRYALEVPPAAARRDGVGAGALPARASGGGGRACGPPEILVDEVTIQSGRGARARLVGRVPRLAARRCAWRSSRACLGHRTRVAGPPGWRRRRSSWCWRALAPLATADGSAAPAPAGVGRGPASSKIRWPARVERTDRLRLGMDRRGRVRRARIAAVLPDHNPPDLQTHVDRTLDFADVPGSTARCCATARTCRLPRRPRRLPPTSSDRTVLVPYPPLPYFAYYALSRMGADPSWAMSAVNVLLAMAVAPVLFLAVRRIWDERAAWLAGGAVPAGPRGVAPRRAGARAGQLRSRAGHGGTACAWPHAPDRLTTPRSVALAGACARAGRARALRRWWCRWASWAWCCWRSCWWTRRGWPSGRRVGIASAPGGGRAAGARPLLLGTTCRGCSTARRGGSRAQHLHGPHGCSASSATRDARAIASGSGLRVSADRGPAGGAHRAAPRAPVVAPGAAGLAPGRGC